MNIVDAIIGLGAVAVVLPLVLIALIVGAVISVSAGGARTRRQNDAATAVPVWWDSTGS